MRKLFAESTRLPVGQSEHDDVVVDEFVELSGVKAKTFRASQLWVNLRDEAALTTRSGESAKFPLRVARNQPGNFPSGVATGPDNRDACHALTLKQ